MTASFQDAIRAAGYEPPDVIEAGRMVRFATNGKRGDEAGWCKLFADGEGGVFGDWRSGDQQVWQAKRNRPFTQAEREAFRKHCEQERREREAAKARERAEAAAMAAAIWKAAQPAPADHGYLIAKGVPPHGLKVYRGPLLVAGMPCEGALIVPAREGGEVHSLEFIHAEHRDGDNKRFLAGGRVTGCYFSIGKPDGALCIAEGFATGASIHEATGYAVAVAFNAGNIEPVVRVLRAKYPDARLILCADDDYRTEGNPGIAKATEAARAVGGLLAVPDFGEGRPEGATDFNDLARVRGPEAVKASVEGAKPPEVSTQDRAANSGALEMPELVTRCFADIEAKPIRWLWPGRIARGKLTIIAGDPGLGKSLLTVSLAAIVTKGGQWPVDRTPCERERVIFLSAEDTPEDTIRPRLDAAGADVRLCEIIERVREPDKDGNMTRRAFNLRKDMARLSELLAVRGDVALVIIDPISAYLGGTESHNNAEVRSLLAEVSEAAGKHQAAFVAVSHLNKGDSAKALYRVTGSLAFVAAARAAFLVAENPESEGQRLFVPMKNNIGPDATGYGFRIEGAQLPNGIETSRIMWEAAAVEVTAIDALAPEDSEGRSALDAAKEFLEVELAAGPVGTKQLQKDAEGAGHKWATIRRAKTALGIEAAKGGMGDGWEWRNPGPKMLKNPEDAHPGGVSAFGENEHLRQPNEPDSEVL